MTRPRAYIPLGEKLAAALACLLPQETRDSLRSGKAPAKAVLALFEWDHIVLHAHAGSDDWHNLDPKLRALHREKSRRDTSIVAKTRRIEPRWKAFTAAMAKGKKPPKRKSKWPKRKMRSAKWAKRNGACASNVKSSR